jgi:hypothetical protein
MRSKVLSRVPTWTRRRTFLRPRVEPLEARLPLVEMLGLLL